MNEQAMFYQLLTVSSFLFLLSLFFAPFLLNAIFHYLKCTQKVETSYSKNLGLVFAPPLPLFFSELIFIKTIGQEMGYAIFGIGMLVVLFLGTPLFTALFCNHIYQTSRKASLLIGFLIFLSEAAIAIALFLLVGNLVMP